MSTSDSSLIAEGSGLPKGWGWSTLGNVSEKPQYGWTTKANHDTGKLKLLRTTDITSGNVDWLAVPFCTDEPEDVEKYLVESGDILISRAGSVGVSFLINKPERAVFASYLIRFRPKAGIDTKYFYYYLKSPPYWEAIGASKSGIAVPNVNASKLAQVPIPIAPLGQQKRIVAEIEKQFSRLDEAVANLKRVKANLKRYKAAVLKAAVEGRLVETEASIARREGRSYETGEQLLQRILDTRRGQWKGKGKYKEPAAPDTTDLPELPEGWVWSELGQLVSSVKDGPHFSPKYSEEGIPFISGGNIRPEGIDFSSSKFISPELHEELSKRCKPEYGDLLYTKGGTTGIARVNTEIREFNVWVHVAVLKLLDSIEPFYLQHTLNSPHCYRQAQKYTHGVGNQDLGLTRMVWITVPLPSAVEQIRIVAEIERRLSLVCEVETQVDANLQRSERLRQCILAVSFSGRLIGDKCLSESAISVVNC